MPNTKKELCAEAVIGELEKRGVIGKSKSVADKKDKTLYHNTKLLLQHYRTISWLLECFPDSIAAELEQPFSSLDTLLNRVESEISSGNRRLEARIENVRRTRLMIDRVNEALTVLKKKPGDGELLYKLIYFTYIHPEVLTHFEILYQINVSSRHYYRLREQAINILSIRLWGSITQESEFLMDLVTSLEDSNQ